VTGASVAAGTRFGFMRELGLIPALVVIVLVGALINNKFLTPINIVNILANTSALALLVLGETLVLIAGKFDLSLESIVGLAPATGLMLVLSSAARGWGIDLPVPVGLVAMLALGALVGAINGTLVVRLRLNAFIVTLAMLIILRGLLLGMTHGETLFEVPDAYLFLGAATVAGLPVSVWLTALCYVAAALFLRYHRLGRALYAIGGNAQAARAAGIRVGRVTIGAYVVAGLLAAVAGLIMCGRVGAVAANQGNGWIFNVFAAAVIGGVSLDGGKGTMLGALTGALLLNVVDNLLTLAQVETFWIQAIYGGIILLALMFSRLTNRAEQV